ncbi:two-component regulator propeller domain-containing protein [Aestuariibaculum suncheonense]|uniref:Two component regulator three Y domain-containing protein n=1 Tax=Aestuariibaculum suncheonense TaxID=1028745 RepID=A0A8J6Q672_9FLAO|nr:two-component regulator propeller domain-containing protein [Aestuariibaculum suncheonense]MBD0834746.1 hypothetical protein [Aestuariibaculum suncheonense]
MRNTFLMWFVFEIVFCKSLLYSQEYLLRFKNLNHKNGLSDFRITDVLQDSNGIIWLGNKITVDRYDGERTISYVLGTNNIINQLIEDQDHNIWAATSKGLFLFNKNENVFEQFENDVLKNQNITSIMQCDDKWLYLSTQNGLLVKIYHNDSEPLKNKFQIIEPSQKIAGFIKKISKGHNNTCWLGCSNGFVYKLKNDSISSIPFNKKNSNTASINDLCEDDSNNLWVATNGNGLYKINLENNTIKHFNRDVNNNKTINNDIVLSLLPIKSDLWIGTDGGGLNLYRSDSESFSYFIQKPSTNSISDNSILSIKQGLNKNIFLGTVHGGVSIFKNKFSIQNIPPKILGFNHIDQQGSIILEDRKGNLWISAGRDGLIKYSPKTKTSKHYVDDPNNKEDLNGSIILSLYEDKSNRLWIGTFRGGLNILDLKSDKFISNYNKKLNSVFSICEDVIGNIWVAQRLGVTIYDPNINVIKELHPVSDSLLLSNGTNSIFRDINGDMWVGTINGLYRYERTKNTLKKHKYLHKDNDSLSLTNNHILSISQTKDLSILVGTYGGGLLKYNRSTDNFSRLNQLGNKGNITNGILTDNNDNIWLSTNSGLVKIDTLGNIYNFDENDGVFPFTGGAAYLDRSGKIIMAGNYGLSYFKTETLSPPEVNFKINFTSASLINKNSKNELLYTDLSEFQNNSNSWLTINNDNILFTIKYACSDPILNEEINYAYKISGLNNIWHEIGPQKSIFFSNLKPGKYTLTLKASDKNGKWSPHTTFIKIKVLPTVWESIWFKMTLLGLITLLVVIIYRWRISKIKTQKEKLKQLLDQRAKEVKNQQSKIAENKIKILEIEKKNQVLKQKKLKDELTFKTKELTNNTLRSVHKNDLLNDIKDNLKKEIRQKTISKDNLKKIISNIDDSFMLDKEWNHFYELFNQIHPSFIANLKVSCPNLNERDVKLCALILMGFTTQNMATLFGISLNSVKVARYRLRRKLNLQESESTVDFLKNLKT